MQTSYNPRPLKQVFNQDNAWEHYLEAHPDEISDNQIEVVEKMLACTIHLRQVRFITNVKKNTVGTPKSFTALAKDEPVVHAASNKQSNG